MLLHVNRSCYKAENILLLQFRVAEVYNISKKGGLLTYSSIRKMHNQF